MLGYLWIYYRKYWTLFVNGPGVQGSIPARVIPKTQKMVLDATLLNSEHYKIRIKVKWSNPGKGVAPSPTHLCSSYRKESLRVTLNYGRQLQCVGTELNILSLTPTIANNTSIFFTCISQNDTLSVNITVIFLIIYWIFFTFSWTLEPLQPTNLMPLTWHVQGSSDVCEV